ncbi:hypothetical protein [Aeromonas veronii]|uniref:hypothetical protein n=1 Tax=Aeromonas veronii TaxID=654 RepID=UPI002415AC10|nr:hypothetical protein [Aeromonas veronii]WFO49860.1 hypothetical protein L1O00_12555 [Aeromonas veronii]
MRIWIMIVMILHDLISISAVQAAMFDRPVPVSVFIVANQGGELEIVADKDAFQVTYDTATARFFPLTIPFTVRSTSDNTVNYDLFMAQLFGRCGDAPPLKMTATLDGTDIEKDNKLRFTGVENDHLATLSFPVIPQTDSTQWCDGSMSIIATLVI